MKVTSASTILILTLAGAGVLTAITACGSPGGLWGQMAVGTAPGKRMVITNDPAAAGAKSLSQ